MLFSRPHPLLLVALFGLAACTEEMAAPPTPAAPLLSRGLSACVQDAVDGVHDPSARCFTYRGVGGISMGGGSAMRIGLEEPQLFDVVAALGAPYIDLEYFLLTVSETSNGGFCEMGQLVENLEYIDLKDDPRIWCGPIDLPELAIEGTNCTGFSGDYNHYYRGPSAGRGGSFGRVASLEIVQDLALAYGNPAFYNPESPYLPPGVPISHHVPLELSDRSKSAERAARQREICERPVRLMPFYDRKYNPEGRYPVITFCDGNGPVAGEYEPGSNDFPVEVVLAVDYNDNGRRDYGEPVLAQPFEPYEDVGTDGLASQDEPGFDPSSNPDPSGDDHHWLYNPNGKERNYRFDDGEPHEDFGLDGVHGTGDFGEGNGRFDLNPNIERAFSRSPRKLLEGLDEVMLDRLHLWVDAGIRDFLHSAQISNQFFGALLERRPGQKRIDDWAALAELTQGVGARFDPTVADFSEARIGRHPYLRYGDASICPGVDAETGRGNHVGTASEVLHRLMSAMAFASARWPDGDFRSLSGGLADQGSPEGSLSDFVLKESFKSDATGGDEPFVAILPPNYYADPEAHFPVLYFLHGQGMKAEDLAASALLFLGPQMASEHSERRYRSSDWQKMIIVFADGECQPGECHTGNFYVDFQGVDGAGTAHGEAFFELMRHVDARFRTKPAAMHPRAD